MNQIFEVLIYVKNRSLHEMSSIILKPLNRTICKHGAISKSNDFNQIRNILSHVYGKVIPKKPAPICVHRRTDMYKSSQNVIQRIYVTNKYTVIILCTTLGVLISVSLLYMPGKLHTQYESVCAKCH